jgi:hypothetical protein
VAKSPNHLHRRSQRCVTPTRVCLETRGLEWLTKGLRQPWNGWFLQNVIYHSYPTKLNLNRICGVTLRRDATHVLTIALMRFYSEVPVTDTADTLSRISPDDLCQSLELSTQG